MKISCGILIVLNKSKVLLCHPTNGSWTNSYSPPKGESDLNENHIDTAIRECFEETSIKIDKNSIKKEFIIDYTKGRSVYKRVHLFLVNITSPSEIGLTSENININSLQKEEIDWCGFLSKSEAEERIFWRFKHLLNEFFN